MNLGRLLPSSRAYSSFFTKPGGRGYFNPSKPPKPLPKRTLNGAADGLATAPEAEPVGAAELKKESAKAPTPLPQGTLLAQLGLQPPPLKPHPDLTLHDLRVHEFFSRQGLLVHLHDPPSIWRQPTQQQQSLEQPSNEEPPSSLSHDSEADVARALTHALCMNRAGAAISWERTLKNLGLDMSQDSERVASHLELANELNEIKLDSTRRKKRKKMKKHKLKKRRKVCFCSVSFLSRTHAL